MQINFLSTRRGARPSPSFSAVDGMQPVILVLCYKTMFYYAHPHYGLGRQRTNQLSSGILKLPVAESGEEARAVGREIKEWGAFDCLDRVSIGGHALIDSDLRFDWWQATIECTIEVRTVQNYRKSIWLSLIENLFNNKARESLFLEMRPSIKNKAHPISHFGWLDRLLTPVSAVFRMWATWF